MRFLKTDPHSLTAAVTALKNEQVVILPTDTLYGFSGIMGKTAHKIARIKGRKAGKPFLALIAQPEDVYAYTDAVIPKALLQYWPGPLTLIVPLKQGGTQAFRCPADTWLRDVVRLTGSPVYSTSVNYAEEKPLTDISAIAAAFEPSVALVIDAGTLTGLPSTIVDLCSAAPRIIRQGAIKINFQY